MIYVHSYMNIILNIFKNKIKQWEKPDFFLDFKECLQTEVLTQAYMILKRFKVSPSAFVPKSQ